MPMHTVEPSPCICGSGMQNFLMFLAVDVNALPRSSQSYPPELPQRKGRQFRREVLMKNGSESAVFSQGEPPTGCRGAAPASQPCKHIHLLSQAGQVCEAPLPYCPAEMEQQRLDDEEMDLDM